MNAQANTRSKPRGILQGLLRKPLAALSLAILLAITMAVAFASWIAPFDPLAQDLSSILVPPNGTHLLGTDPLGRDVFSRMLYGGQPALLGVFIAVGLFLLLGVSLGILAGYLGGKIDRIIAGVVDTLLALPNIVIVLAVLAIFTQSLSAAMVTFGIMASGNLVRVVRGVCLSIREELFVAAALVSGLGHGRIMFKHVLPAIVGPTIVQAAFFSGVALSIQTGLGFLGLATLPPAPSWGGMVGEASAIMVQTPYLLYVTGGIIALMTLAFGLFGDGLRDVMAEKKSGKTAAAAKPIDVPVGKRPGRVATDALLELRDYSVGFHTSSGSLVNVVNQVSFSIQRGEILGLVGESGSGKTVTALSLLGLLPPNGQVTGGNAWLHDEPIAYLGESGYKPIRGHKIGLISQEPMVALDPLFTIGNQLCEVLKHLVGGTKGRLRTRAIELLASVGLPDPERLLRKYPHELSGGMIQRVVIAMALAGDPDLLIADEPTTALDVTVQAGILDLLRELRDNRGLAVLLVTHDLGVVADLCDRAIVMTQGTIVESAQIEDLFYDPQHEYTKQLIQSTPNLELPV